MFNENITIALIVSAAPTLAVIGSMVINIKSANKQNTKLDEIHVLTNDNFTKALKKIDQLEKVINKQRELLSR